MDVSVDFAQALKARVENRKLQDFVSSFFYKS